MRNILLALLFLFSRTAIRAIEMIGEPVVEAAATEVTIHWKTVGISGGKVRFGVDEAKLEQSVEDGIATEPRLRLTGLKPRTRYFFSVGTARKPIGKGSFITGGDSSGHALAVKSDAPKSGPVAPVEAPPTRRTWGNISSLQDHYDRHGADFYAKSPDDYAEKAWRFREQAVEQKFPMKLDADGTVRIFNPKTLAFASFNKDGTTKTYFRPNSPSYWQRQPGTPIAIPPWQKR